MNPPKLRRRPRLGKPGALEIENHKQRPANKRNAPGAQAAALIADPVFRRRVQRVHGLGGDVVAFLLAKIAVEHDCERDIRRWLDRAVENEAAIRLFGEGRP